MRPVASGLVRGDKTLAMTCVKPSRKPACLIHHLSFSLVLLLSCLLLFCTRVMLPCLGLSCLAHLLFSYLGILHPIHSVATLSCIRCAQASSVRLHSFHSVPFAFVRLFTSLSLSLSRTPPIRLQDTQSIAYARSFMKSHNRYATSFCNFINRTLLMLSFDQAGVDEIIKLEYWRSGPCLLS